MIKASDFEHVYIDSWKKFEKYNSNNKWIYRGQRNAKWTFKTSLDRLSKSINAKKEAHIVERILTAEFKRRFHQYSQYIPAPEDNLEWLSIMRHYMAPTRLLDWNYSIYIATYFALERESDNKEEGAAVWALNSEWANKESKRRFLENGRDKKDVECIIEKPSYTKNAMPFKRLFLTEPFIKTVCPLAPKRLTERITVQKGVFLCPGNPNVTIDENIESMDGFNDKENIVRLIIPRQKRMNYLENLYKMNITHTTLFPGLDGFAYSLSVYHYSFEKSSLDKSPYKGDDSVWNT
jgi:hypothetical protein